MRYRAARVQWILNEERELAQQDKVRLQKYLSECGVASRRKAEALITRGRVQVNGAVVTELGTKIAPGIDEVRVKGKLVLPEEKGIILFHKPEHVITSMEDPQGRPTVADYLSKKYLSYFPVGRLDFDSTGLVIMTNDGELAQTLLHPKFQVERTYDVLVEGSVSYEISQRFDRGIQLEDGIVRGDAHVLDIPGGLDVPGTWVRVTITIGRNRVVRRTFDKLGHPVIKLHRIKHGPFRLGSIRSGGMEKFTERQYREVRAKLLRLRPVPQSEKPMARLLQGDDFED
ncbi:MAG: rRNA pseudouridine synthase [Proteobacteria bacterium]|nr:rRNA pseudouridine synthase [Pseudomonadota bacterium]